MTWAEENTENPQIREADIAINGEPCTA